MWSYRVRFWNCNSFKYIQITIALNRKKVEGFYYVQVQEWRRNYGIQKDD